jgi:hypothetical protein
VQHPARGPAHDHRGQFRLLRKYQKQASTLARLESDSPGILRIHTDDEGAVVVDESDGECDVNTLLAEIELAMNVR